MNNNSSEENTGNSSKPMKEKTKEDFIAELKSEERYINYFQNFHPISIQRFIDSFARNKETWWKNGDFYVSQNESEDLQWIDKARDHLEIIQQKKLFDAQCLWRAEKVVYEEVKICFDFEVWEKNILHCAFIEPVNDDDIRLYTEYLFSNNVYLEDFWYEESWQDYDEIVEAYKSDNENRNFPEWYDYCNGRRGTGVLMSLPDIRGEKERFYTSLYFAAKRKENQKAYEESEAQRDKRPSISFYNDEQLEYFIKTFEDKETQYYYKAYKRNTGNYEEEEQLRSIIDVLLKAEENVPIEAHHDFKEALNQAYEKYKAKKIAEFLPYAFDEYKLNRSMNFGASAKALKDMKDYMSVRETWYNNITNGRVLNGESADLNF